MSNRRALAFLLGLAALLGPSAALSDDRDKTAIIDALTTWTRNFNSANTAGICDIFSPELRYDFRGAPERGFNDICTALRGTLDDSSKTQNYSFRIKEIIVSGDLAVVRLVWTLRVRPVGSAVETTTEEPGMDVFRKDGDGRWRIIRYLAFEK